MSSKYDREENVCEDDYWYLGSVPLSLPNVAYTLYGVKKNQNRFKKLREGCHTGSYINSFYTTAGFTTFTGSLYAAGVDGFSSYASNNDGGGLSAKCGNGYGVACDANHDFVYNQYDDNKVCDSRYYVTTADPLSDLNAKLAKTKCFEIYNANTATSSQNNNNNNNQYSPVQWLLTYSESCRSDDPAGACPDPHGRLQYNEAAMELAYSASTVARDQRRLVASFVLFAVAGLLFFTSTVAFCREARHHLATMRKFRKSRSGRRRRNWRRSRDGDDDGTVLSNVSSMIQSGSDQLVPTPVSTKSRSKPSLLDKMKVRLVKSGSGNFRSRPVATAATGGGEVELPRVVDDHDYDEAAKVQPSHDADAAKVHSNDDSAVAAEQALRNVGSYDLEDYLDAVAEPPKPNGESSPNRFVEAKNRLLRSLSIPRFDTNEDAELPPPPHVEQSPDTLDDLVYGLGSSQESPTRNVSTRMRNAGTYNDANDSYDSEAPQLDRDRSELVQLDQGSAKARKVMITQVKRVRSGRHFDQSLENAAAVSPALGLPDEVVSEVASSRNAISTENRVKDAKSTRLRSYLLSKHGQIAGVKASLARANPELPTVPSHALMVSDPPVFRRQRPFAASAPDGFASDRPWAGTTTAEPKLPKAKKKSPPSIELELLDKGKNKLVTKLSQRKLRPTELTEEAWRDHPAVTPSPRESDRTTRTFANSGFVEVVEDSPKRSQLSSIFGRFSRK